jgi:hypothetical protein
MTYKYKGCIEMIDKGNVSFFNGKSIVKHTNTNQKIYHYTSPMGLYSIIENKRVWFTDCQFMNDMSEFVYIKKVLLHALDSKEWKNVKDMQEYADYILSTPYQSFELNEHDANKPFSFCFTDSRYYLFCTSLKSDSHNMWSYFMHNGNYTGYNIGFDVARFVNLFSSFPGVTLTHGKVIYDEDEQVKQVKDKIGLLNIQFEKELEKKANILINMEMSMIQKKFLLTNIKIIYLNFCKNVVCFLNTMHSQVKTNIVLC